MNDVPSTSKQRFLNDKGPFSRERLEKVLFGINPGDSTTVTRHSFDNAVTAVSQIAEVPVGVCLDNFVLPVCPFDAPFSPFSTTSSATMSVSLRHSHYDTSPQPAT